MIVGMYDTISGDIIAEYPGKDEAADACGMPESTVRKQISGRVIPTGSTLCFRRWGDGPEGQRYSAQRRPCVLCRCSDGLVVESFPSMARAAEACGLAARTFAHDMENGYRRTFEYMGLLCFARVPEYVGQYTVGEKVPENG